MSYANGLAKINPVAGLWSASIPALVYGTLGTCRYVVLAIPTSLIPGPPRQLSLGPEAALSLLIGQMVGEAVYGDPHNIPKNPELEAAAIALITTLQVSVNTLRTGSLAQYRLADRRDHQHPRPAPTRFPRRRPVPRPSPRLHHRRRSRQSFHTSPQRKSHIISRSYSSNSSSRCSD